MFNYGVYSLTISLIILLIVRKCFSVSVPNDPESWKRDWFQEGQTSLEQTLEEVVNTNVARNVILFLGDGMGLSTVTAGRIYMGQMMGRTGEEGSLAFDKFPNVALAKTYNVDHQVPDSAGTATAFLCGVKTNIGVLGVDQSVYKEHCNDMTEASKVYSILRWSIQEGKRTGVVTTTRVTHATPGASYAHTPHRDWESDADVDPVYRGKCFDIARQLVENNSDINVILGGGRQKFLPNGTSDPEYGISAGGKRLDGRDLTQFWLNETRKRSSSATYVWNRTQFDQVNPDTTDYLLGLFEPSHMKYVLDRKNTSDEDPTLAQMAEKAIRILSREKKGYFLLVEGGRIDHGHHDNLGKAALAEVVSFNDAIDRALQLTDQSDTLIVVTADHSHVFTVGGYPTRGNPILGFVDQRGLLEENSTDGLPFLTLSYANGPSQYLGRTNLTGIDTQANNFTQPVNVPMKNETHGGEDVAIYAIGPMAHLFRGVQEQNYIAHVMAYASCVGVNKKHCAPIPQSSATCPISRGIGTRVSVIVAALVSLIIMGTL